MKKMKKIGVMIIFVIIASLLSVFVSAVACPCDYEVTSSTPGAECEVFEVPGSVEDITCSLDGVDRSQAQFEFANGGFGFCQIFDEEGAFEDIISFPGDFETFEACKSVLLEGGDDEDIDRQGVFDQFIGHAIAQDLLIDKELFVSHIIKEETYSLEFKEIEIAWRQAFIDSNCQLLPIMFMLSKGDIRTGKLEESDALLDLFRRLVGEPGALEAFGMTQAQLNSFINIIEQILQAEQDGNNKLAAQTKCCAYNQLLEQQVLTLRPDDGFCGVISVRKPPGGGSSGGSPGGSVCTLGVLKAGYKPVGWPCSSDFNCQEYAKKTFLKPDPENYYCGSKVDNGVREGACQCFHKEEKSSSSPQSQRPAPIPPPEETEEDDFAQVERSKTAPPIRIKRPSTSLAGRAVQRETKGEWVPRLGIIIGLIFIFALIAILLRPKKPKPKRVLAPMKSIPKPKKTVKHVKKKAKRKKSKRKKRKS